LVGHVVSSHGQATISRALDGDGPSAKQASMIH
jgi:hypothetical protein